MPPAISDDEQSDAGIANIGTDVVPDAGSDVEVDVEVTLRKKPDTDDEAPKEEEDVAQENGGAGEDGEDEEGDQDDEDEEIFNVELIIDHKVDKNGDIHFLVKWEGYSKKSDQTWEPEENLLEGADDILADYYKQCGSRALIVEEATKARGKKRGRQSAGATSSAATTSKRARKNGEHPANGTPPASAKSNTWKPPSGSWEDEVETIDACEDEETGKLIVYLNWKNGQKTKHGTDVVYKRCPQKMLQFYERHIRIIKNVPAAAEVEETS